VVAGGRERGLGRGRGREATGRQGTAALAVGLLVLVAACAGCSSSGTAAPATSAATTAATGTAPSSAPPVPSPGCSIAQAAVAAPAVTNQRETIEVDGTSRWYLLNLPATTTPSPVPTSPGASALSTPRPLVLDFHGLAEGATIHSATSRFGTLGQQDGFIAVFPNGTGSPVHWNTTAQSGNQDLDFVTALLTQLEATRCIDTSRVYASGFSDGAFFVSLLACTMSNRFAAIAAVSGLQLDKPCHTTRPVPILTFHGTADPILYFNGGVGTATLNKLLGATGTGSSGSSGSSTTTTTLPKANLHGAGYPATVQAWAVKDGCDPHPTDTRQSSQIIVRRYACPAGTDVEFTIVLGGGHAWPGSAFSKEISAFTGFTTFQVDATAAIWTFFQRFTLPS